MSETMNESREYFESNGVTFYYVRNKDYHRAKICNDIDVEPGVKEVTFEFDSIGTYELMDSGKVFPEVKTLNINKWGRTLRIPNGMFPNVTKVKTDKYGSYYKSGCMLVNDKGVLQNTFHPDSDVIDLKGVSVIDNGSFAGCQATKFINSGSVKQCRKHAFKGSAIEKMPVPAGGALMVGSIIVDIDKNAADIVMPDTRQAISTIREGLDYRNIQSITFNKIQSFVNVQERIPERIKIILKETGFIGHDMIDFWTQSKASCLELCDENPYYKTIDGALFTKDGTVLIKYPSSRAGHYDIPEGTTTIASRAFYSCELSSVTIPSSMRQILPKAFAECKKLSSVDIRDGIKNLGIGRSTLLFYNCNSLKHIEIPSSVQIIAEQAFDGCNLESVKFNEGLLQIMDNVFTSSLLTRDITLPSTLDYIGGSNFQSVKQITVLGDKIPFGLISAVTAAYEQTKKSKYITLRCPNKTLFLPRYITVTSAEWLDSNLSIPSFREECENSLYSYGELADMKQETAIATYKENPSSDLRTYLRRVSKNIVGGYVSGHNETELIEFIKLGLMTKKAMQDALQSARENSMPTVEAYLLKAINESDESNSTFSL